MISRNNVVTTVTMLTILALFPLLGPIQAAAQTSEPNRGAVPADGGMPPLTLHGSDWVVPTVGLNVGDVVACAISEGLELLSASPEEPAAATRGRTSRDCPLYVSMALFNPDMYQEEVDACNAEYGTDNCLVIGVCKLTAQFERDWVITSSTWCRYDGCMGFLDAPISAVEATFMSADPR